ncbi:DUF1376 domain-containing protein [Methylibium petroleiphilum]|uniref:DUF1376 domain-containing protein n=1 Tax=Methylibium petroleiphilum TaxID=105560 RepID=UPI0013054659|nr:DUF1376 domain-containing protein [Methylibium petroleiphilum]
MNLRRRNKQGNDRVLGMTANGFTISSSLPTEEKTALMSNAALGCYVKLMCFAWREGSIPNDIPSIARLCGETPAALQAIWHQIRPCFSEDVFLPGRLVHDGLQEQRATSKASHAARSAAGAIGAERRWRQSKSAVQLLPKADVAAQPAPAAQAKTAKTQPTGDLFGEPEQAVVIAKPSNAIPPCPQAEIVAIYHEVMRTNPRVLTWGGEREKHLRARWREMAATNHPQLGGYDSTEKGLLWWRRFFEHCTKSAYLTGRAEPKPGGGAYATPTLEWMLRPTKFALILEGFYHRERT